jgi:MFS family permease
LEPRFGPTLSPIAVPLITEFKIDFTKFSYLSGYCLLITGAVGIFIAAGTRKWGTRPGLIFSMVFAFVGVVWAAFAKSYSSFLGARMIQGLSMAYFESVVYAFIGNLYFVHERGTRMAFFVITYQSLSNLPALVAGKMTETMGWRWVFYLLSIFVGIGLLLAIFFGWETAYNRQSLETSEITTEEVCINTAMPNIKTNNWLQDLARVEEIKGGSAETFETVEGGGYSQPRQSLIARMKPVQGIYSRDSLLKLLVTPFLTLLNPAVIWAVITLAFPVLWLVGLSLVIAQIFAGPPYSLNPTELGYMWAGRKLKTLSFRRNTCSLTTM